MVSRKFKASPVKVTGLTPQGVPFESSLEEDQFFHLRFQAREVASFSRPPGVVVWFDKTGKRHTYTPDVLIYFKKLPGEEQRCPVLGEIKPDFGGDMKPKARLPRSETDEQRALKWAAATNHAVMRGWKFKVFRECEIRAPLLQNVKFLIRHLEAANLDQGSGRILATLREGGPKAIKDFMFGLEPDRVQRAMLFPTLWACIADGRVKADLSMRLNDATVLSAA